MFKATSSISLRRLIIDRFQYFYTVPSYTISMKTNSEELILLSVFLIISIKKLRASICSKALPKFILVINLGNIFM